MKKGYRSNHRVRNTILLTLLIILGVVVVELVAIRCFSPALYQRLTAPVRSGIEAVGSAGRRVASQAAALWEDLTTRDEEEETPEPSSTPQLENQLVSEPVLVDTEPVTDPSVTELITRDGREVLTGGLIDIIYYNQTDELWADQPYGRDHIGGYGCGPTVMSIAVSSLTGEIVDPAAMAQRAVEQRHWARGNGSYYTIVEETAQAYGLRAESFSGRTPEELQNALLSGNLLVALMGPGHFTQGGHFILLRGITLSGMVLVADPSSRERSLTAWEAQLILDELSASTGNGAPLWVVSRPLS